VLAQQRGNLAIFTRLR